MSSHRPGQDQSGPAGTSGWMTRYSRCPNARSWVSSAAACDRACACLRSVVRGRSRWLVQAGPYDAVSLSGPVGAPAVRPGQGPDDVQPVRAAVGLPGPPGAAEVFDLDPDGTGAGLSAG